MFNFNTAIHMPTHRLTSNGQHKNHSKNVFFWQKECSQPRLLHQEMKVPMVQIYIYVFLKISDLESL